MKEQDQIVIYKTGSSETSIEVQVQKDTVWLNQEHLAKLFERDQSVISRHVNNIFKEGELDKKSNMQKMHIPNSDNVLVALTLMIAESHPNDKDMMIKVVVNLLANHE